MESVFGLVREVTHQGVQIAADGIWIAIPLALLAAIGWRFTVKASAGIGCRVWWAAILITLALPFALNLAPSSFDLWPDTTFSIASNTPRAMPASRSILAADPQTTPVSKVTRTVSHPVTTPSIGDYSRATPSAERVTWQSVAVGLAPLIGVWLWLLVSSILLVRLLFGLRSMYRLKDNALPVDLEAHPLISKAVSSARTKHTPVVAISNSLATPVAAGLGHPMVIIPRDIFASFSERELDMIVRHEITHLERRDDWLVLVQRLIQSVLCFNPILHWMARRLDLAREMACDERVVDQCRSARDYAHCLARLATLPKARTPLLATGALTGRKHIISRFDQLLALSRRGKRPVLRVALATILMLVATAATVKVAPVVDVPLHKVTLTEVKSLWADAEPTAESNSTASEQGRSAVRQSNSVKSEQTASTSARHQHTASKYTEAQHAYAEARSNESRSTAVGIGSAGGSASIASVEGDEDDAESGIGQKASRWAKGVFDALSKGTSVISDGSGNTTYSWSDGRHKLQVRSRGDVRIADDDRSIESISRRGYIVIYERVGGDERELEIEPGDDGNLEYSYFVDGRKHDFDDEAKKWFGEVLLTVIRNTGWNAENRVERIYKNKGTKGVLDEIDLIDGSYAKRNYYQILMDVADLTADDYKRILEQAETQIDSDYEKAELLISLSDNIKDNADLLPLFVDAVATIDSDYETRRVLSAISLDHRTDRNVLLAVMKIADRMDSDYEKAELLIDLADLTEKDPELQVTYVESLRGMDSDYETRRVLTALIHSGPIDQKAIDNILDISKFIHSDYEKAELLIDLANLTEDDANLHGRVMEAVATIDSDYESRRVIQSWAIDCRKNPDLMMPLLNSAENIASDYERAELLIGIAECLTDEMGSFQRFLDVTEDIGSGYEHARVLSAVINDYETEFSEDQVKALILSAREVSTDYEKARILDDLIGFCKGKGNLEDELADAIDTIDSDYEADGLLAKLYRGSRKRGLR